MNEMVYVQLILDWSNLIMSYYGISTRNQLHWYDSFFIYIQLIY